MKKPFIQSLIKPSINKIAKYVPGQSTIAGSDKIIKLSSNESPFTIPKKIISLIPKLALKTNFYPDGDSNLLKKTISKKFGLKKNQIVCGNGSDDILSVICQTFSRENCEVICSEYGFIYYPIIAKANGANVVIAKSENLSISCKNILKKITSKTNLIFLANPNNPTGTVIFKDELTNFLKQVPKNIIVVLDGAYSEFIQDSRYSDGLELVEKFSNLIITRTFSKIFALAGLRLGWSYSCPEIVHLLEKIRGPFNINAIAQIVGSLILKDKNFLKRSINHNRKWQKKLVKKINDIGLEAKETFTNFVLVKVEKKKIDKKKILCGLLKKKIIVRDLTSYDLADYFRVSMGTDVQLDKFSKELANLVRKYSK